MLRLNIDELGGIAEVCIVDRITREFLFTSKPNDSYLNGNVTSLAILPKIL